MKQNSFSKKRIIHACVVIFIVVLLIIISFLFMLKYNVEGEKNLPFNIKSINIISTAESDIKQDETEQWHAGILQKNDVFIVIGKNENYKKVDTIKEVRLENFKIEQSNENAVINIYRPKSNKYDFTYIDEYNINETIKYEGALETNVEVLQINNQGGKIGFCITQKNLGEYNFSINEKVPSDGKLLAKAGLKNEDIEFKVYFDLIIETGNGNKFKTNIVLELPTGNILEEGVSTKEDSQLENLIFKRIK